MLIILLRMYEVNYTGGNMPGFIIHLATANEYVKKHKNQIENKQNLIRGCIYPDLTMKVEKTINEVSKCDLNTVKNEIIAGEYIEKWERIRKLKRLD